MVADRLVATLAVVALLVLAGCAGGPAGESGNGTASPTSSPQPTDAPSQATPTPPTDATDSAAPSLVVRNEVTVENGTLPVNATLTYARVQSLTGTDSEPYPVRVRNLSEWRGAAGTVGAVPVNRALGYENASTDWSEPSGLARPTGAMFVHPGNGTSAEIDRVLAHEYGHVVQFEERILPWLSRLNQPRLTTDRVYTRRSLVEGGAVYVSDAYTEQYLDIRNNSAHVRELYQSSSATTRSALAPYVFGNQYVDQRIDDPENLSKAYDSYPRTTEQLIHNHSRTEEPPANLSVTADAASDRWAYRGNDTMGELFTRTTLETELDRDRAANAGTGWGTDRLTVFEHATNESRNGWTWVMRWDTPGEASELEAALTAYADARDGDSSQSFRVETVSDVTVALVFGDSAFVERAEVTGTDGNVTVTVPA